MAFTLDQLQFLGLHVGVVIPPEFVENKRRAEEFKKRAEQLGTRREEIKQRRDGAKLEELLDRALKAGNGTKNFAGALDLFNELEVGLNAPDLPPPQPEPEPEVPDSSTPEGAYQSAKAKVIGVINEAARESADIGGEEIRTWIEKLTAKERAADWPAASELLRKTHQKALTLNQRKPYIKARQEQIHKINAAKKIKVAIPESDKSFGKHKTYGDAVGADWDAVLALVKNSDFDGAAAGTIALANRIDTKISPAVAKAREQNATQLSGLKDDLEAAKQNGDLGAMRTLAEKIFKNTAESESLGVDAGENARKPFVPEGIWTADKCEATFVAYDWFALKKCRKARKISVGGEELAFSDDDMWKLVQFRGKVVNEVIDSLRKEYPTLIAKASGSEDIESDIDITFATPGSGDDVKAAEKFNAAIKSRFKKPPGRVFDVNIYPRDYGAIKESFKGDYNIEEIKDENIDEPEQEESAKLSKIDQDVATLLKQRRFLDTEKFNQMLQALLDSAPDVETRKRIEKQYEEGEDIYLLTSLEKVDTIRAKVDLGKPAKDEPKHMKELRAKLDQLDKLKSKSDRDSLAKMQVLLPEVLDLFEEALPAETMDVTDAQYLEKMGSLRKDQDAIRSLKKDIAPADAHHPKQTCDQAHPKQDHEAWRKQQLNALEVKVKKDMFTNIVFANEAIMSQGALKHVVVALQAKTPEERAKALAQLEASDLMQSVNEQVADLAKEMKHYEGVVEEAEESEGEEGSKEAAKRRATGEGFVHASKYFFRLLDAAILLIEKYKDNPEVSAVVSKPYEALKTKEKMALDVLKKRVDDVLLKLRKSAVIPPDVKGEVGALEVGEIFQNITDIAGFRKMITDFAIELNLRIRSMEDFKKSQEMTTGKEKAAEQAYFEAAAPKAAEPGSKEEAENKIRAILNKPLVLDAKLTAHLEKAGIANGKTITNSWKSVLEALKSFKGGNQTKVERGQKAVQDALDGFGTIIGQLPPGDVQAALREARDKLSAQFDLQQLAIGNPKAFASLEADFKKAESLNAELHPLLAELPKAALDDSWRRQLIAAQKQLQTATKKLHASDAKDKEMPEAVLQRKMLLIGSLDARLEAVKKGLSLPKCKPIATQADFKKADALLAKTGKLTEKAQKAGLTKASRSAITAAEKELLAIDRKLHSTDDKHGQLAASVLKEKTRLTSGLSDQLQTIKKMLGGEASSAPQEGSDPSAKTPVVGRKEAQAQWQSARTTAIAQLKSLGDALKKSKDLQATQAIVLVRGIQANLTAKPESLKDIDELERYLQTDDIIEEAETPNGFGIEISLRKPLLSALTSLRTALTK